jgi:hypothetical protein
MIEHAQSWTTNLDQLAWAVAEWAIVLAVIVLAVRGARG